MNLKLLSLVLIVALVVCIDAQLSENPEQVDDGDGGERLSESDLDAFGERGEPAVELSPAPS